MRKRAKKRREIHFPLMEQFREEQSKAGRWFCHPPNMAFKISLVTMQDFRYHKIQEIERLVM